MRSSAACSMRSTSLAWRATPSWCSRPTTVPTALPFAPSAAPCRTLPFPGPYRGALAAPSTAYQYDWNMLPIGQQLWLKELESYVTYPPLQSPATYNLAGVVDEVKKQLAQRGHAGD